MFRRLRCLFRKHDWVDGQDPVSQHITKECSRCGARRDYSADPWMTSDDRFRAPPEAGGSGGAFL